MSNLYSVGQMNEHANALEQAGWTTAQVKKAASGTFLKSILDVLEGRAQIVYQEHVINLDADPFTPEGWKVEEHQKGGQFTFDPKQVELFLADGQKNGKYIEGNTLRKELAKKPCFNANLLDYLLAHQDLIPESWKGRAVFFWGTIYRDSRGYRCVRYLSWGGDQWDWRYDWLSYGWGGRSPAALRAS